MAILLRSVNANGEPITRALSRHHIPYVVVGMNNLFGTAEAEAARQLFYFLASRPTIDGVGLEQFWQQANLGLDPTKLRAAIASLEKTRSALDDPTQQRFSYYSIQRTFLNFLEQAGIREETIPNGRGEVV